ncbi:MAG: hypothetical protein ACK5MS_11225, partial [Planctomyces sp.]
RLSALVKFTTVVNLWQRHDTRNQRYSLWRTGTSLNPGPFLRARTPSSAAATVNRHQLRVPGSQYDIQNTLFRNTPDDLIAFGHESFPGAR